MRWVPLSSRSPPALLTAAKGGMSLTRRLCALFLAGLAALSVVVRPTATLTWLYVGLYTLFTLPGTWPRFVLIRDTVVIAAGAVVVSCLADRLYYGVWVFVYNGLARCFEMYQLNMAVPGIRTAQGQDMATKLQQR